MIIVITGVLFFIERNFSTDSSMFKAKYLIAILAIYGAWFIICVLIRNKYKRDGKKSKYLLGRWIEEQEKIYRSMKNDIDELLKQIPQRLEELQALKTLKLP